MKLGLNACILIVLMLIMVLVAPASTKRAAASYCVWDATAKKNVCVSSPSQLAQPTSQPTASCQSTVTSPYPYGCHWDSTAKKNVCGSAISVPTCAISNPTAPTTSSSPHSCRVGYTYYSSISTKLCGVQYNVCVNFDYNCANDYHP
jgi:hypothetical protein